MHLATTSHGDGKPSLQNLYHRPLPGEENPEKSMGPHCFETVDENAVEYSDE
jgi:hypothetical protein